MFGSIVAAVDGLGSLFAVSLRSLVLVDSYGDCLGGEYNSKLIEYLIFDLRFLKRCPQKVSSSVFETLSPFSITKFIITGHKGTERRH